MLIFVKFLFLSRRCPIILFFQYFSTLKGGCNDAVLRQVIRFQKRFAFLNNPWINSIKCNRKESWRPRTSSHAKILGAFTLTNPPQLLQCHTQFLIHAIQNAQQIRMLRAMYYSDLLDRHDYLPPLRGLHNFNFDLITSDSLPQKAFRDLQEMK